MSRKRKERKKTAKINSTKRRNASKVPKGFSTPVMQHFVMQNPLHGLTDLQRHELFGYIGRTAALSFKENFQQLETLVREYNPFELLSTASLYALFQSFEPDKDLTEEGPYLQAFIEVLQSVCLRFGLDNFGTFPVLHDRLFRILDLTKNCSDDFAKQRFSSAETANAIEKKHLLAIEGARLHTQAMRNWGHPQHMKSIIRALLEPLDKEFETVNGIKLFALLAVFDSIEKAITERVNEFLATFRPLWVCTSLEQIVNAFCTIAGASDTAGPQILDTLRTRRLSLQQAQFFLLSYFHQYVPKLFVFNLDELLNKVEAGFDVAKVGNLFKHISFQFGDLQSEDPEHLMMQSKVRVRPLIWINDRTFFLPIVGLLHSSVLEIVETFIARDNKLKERYHQRRAVFLEDYLSQQLAAGFSGCAVHRGTTGISPIDGREFENDCLVVAGPIALVFEAKSERVADAARRGASKTLRDHYESLVDDPAGQAERFAQILESGQGLQKFSTKKDGSYDLDLSSIKRVICISVILDWFPSAMLCWKQLAECGLVTTNRRPTLNVDLGDLIVITETLDKPEMLLHYFWRRIEWEEHVLYLGDEEDLLVYYLSEGMTIREELRNGTVPMLLHGRSNALWQYYLAASTDPNTKVPRPRRLLTEWWSAILRRVAQQSHLQRWEIACILLDLSFENQQWFEKMFTKIIARVTNKGNDCDKNGFYCAVDKSESNGVVVGFAYRNLSYNERNMRASNLAVKAQEATGASRIVIIGRDVDRCGDLYAFLAFVDSTIPQASVCKHPDV